MQVEIEVIGKIFNITVKKLPKSIVLNKIMEGYKKQFERALACTFFSCRNDIEEINTQLLKKDHVTEVAKLWNKSRNKNNK